MKSTDLPDLFPTICALPITKVETLDDLVLQFDGTPAGQSFIAAWKQARLIVDSGHGAGGEEGGGPPTPNP